ncbi:hypothetical protein SVTN_36425 [Streptomyces vietnamensis]|uniref:Uncharacterized protein n=1 Tax=Streptomyces vietnamensis TaxID=362257 RepID=A0A0B5IH02_9ACTN|nr:hypothetical protein SVTN_36425 [Streptomyces vietnamensis]
MPRRDVPLRDNPSGQDEETGRHTTSRHISDGEVEAGVAFGRVVGCRLGESVASVAAGGCVGVFGASVVLVRAGAGAGEAGAVLCGCGAVGSVL